MPVPLAGTRTLPRLSPVFRRCDLPAAAEAPTAGGRSRGPSSPLMSIHPPWHVPVMSAEVTETLQPGPGRVLVDGTLGDGGHAAAWLEAGGVVVGH